MSVKLVKSSIVATMNTFLLHFPLYFDGIFSRQFTLHFRFLLENFTQDGFRSLFFSLALIRQVWFSFRFLSSLDWLMEHFSSMFRVSNLLWKRRVGALSFVGNEITENEITKIITLHLYCNQFSLYQFFFKKSATGQFFHLYDSRVN